MYIYAKYLYTMYYTRLIEIIMNSAHTFGYTNQSKTRLLGSPACQFAPANGSPGPSQGVCGMFEA